MFVRLDAIRFETASCACSQKLASILWKYGKLLDRRTVLRTFEVLPVPAAGAQLLPIAGCRFDASPEQAQQGAAEPHQPALSVKNQPSNFDPASNRLLDKIGERAAHSFVDRADSRTGIVFDRAPANGVGAAPQYTNGSIAATGFGLSVLCVAGARLRAARRVRAPRSGNA